MRKLVVIWPVGAQMFQYCGFRADSSWLVEVVYDRIIASCGWVNLHILGVLSVMVIWVVAIDTLSFWPDQGLFPPYIACCRLRSHYWVQVPCE